MTKISKIFFGFIFIAILSIFEEQEIELPGFSHIWIILESSSFLRRIEEIEVFQERVQPVTGR